MSKIRIFVIVAILSTGMMSAQAQRQVTGQVKADIVSSFVWGGQNFGDVSLQPELWVAWKGLSLSAWGSVGLSNKDDSREVDLTLTYETSGLSLGIVDYWNDGNDSRYFYYEKDGTSHAFEGFIGYDFGPVRALWQTQFAGNDYQRGSDKRAYSTYIELSAPFRLATLDWNAAVGLVPWKSWLYEVSGFNLTNLSLRATKAIKITDSFSLPLSRQIVATPASQHFFFVCGFTLNTPLF